MSGEAVQRERTSEAALSASASSDAHSEALSTSAVSLTAAAVSGSESAEGLDEAAAETAGAETDLPGTESIDAAGSAAESGTDAAASASSASAALRPRPTEATLADLAALTLTVTCPHAPGRLGVTMSSEHSAGALVCAIEKHSRADRAGLRLGDAILSVNGVEAGTAVRVKELITECASQREPLTLLVERARPVTQLRSTRTLESRAFARHCAPCTGGHNALGSW